MSSPMLVPRDGLAGQRIADGVSGVGRDASMGVVLDHPSVSLLHAEVVRRGRLVYVCDLGLSVNGTRVNGRPVTSAVLADGDVVTFGSVRCLVTGLVAGRDDVPPAERPPGPRLTGREEQVLEALCRPALSDRTFVLPLSAAEIAAELVVTEAAVKQHLLRLYAKFAIPDGLNRRTRLANRVLDRAQVSPIPPMPPAEPTPSGRSVRRVH